MSNQPEVLCSWSARSVQPIVLLYVAGVFLGFILIAHFVVHSKAAVQALALAAIGALVPLAPLVMRRIKYRITKDEIQKKKPGKDEEAGFDSVVKLDDLDRISPKRHGFKFFKRLDEQNSFTRFVKRHVSDKHSGEVHVETADQERVMTALEDLGAPIV